jgi:DNA-binding XRE family transcriptional regulator
VLFSSSLVGGLKKSTMSEIYKNKVQIRKNIKTIRHYLELNQTEFAKKTGIGKRAIEFETGRFLPTEDELKKIASLAEIDVSLIKHFRLQTNIDVY